MVLSDISGQSSCLNCYDLLQQYLMWAGCEPRNLHQLAELPGLDPHYIHILQTTTDSCGLLVSRRHMSDAWKSSATIKTITTVQLQ